MQVFKRKDPNQDTQLESARASCNLFSRDGSSGIEHLACFAAFWRQGSGTRLSKGNHECQMSTATGTLPSGLKPAHHFGRFLLAPVDVRLFRCMPAFQPGHLVRNRSLLPVCSHDFREIHTDPQWEFCSIIDRPQRMHSLCTAGSGIHDPISHITAGSSTKASKSCNMIQYSII